MIMSKFFLILTRMSFGKKMRELLDERFHAYIPEDSKLTEPNLVHCGESKDNPDANLILEKMS